MTSFYREHAQHMPGWGNGWGLPALDPHGLPSGATAQHRATHHVGGVDPTGVWTGVRHRLVEKQRAAIALLPRGPEGRPVGNLGFSDVYRAHVDAFHDAQRTARAKPGNPFGDPLSFALALYGLPLLEHAGIPSGPIIGAAIDVYNDPTESVAAGWLKRVAVGLGGLLAGFAVAGPVGMLPGAFSLAWNTFAALRALTPPH